MGRLCNYSHKDVFVVRATQLEAKSCCFTCPRSDVVNDGQWLRTFGTVTKYVADLVCLARHRLNNECESLRDTFYSPPTCTHSS